MNIKILAAPAGAAAILVIAGCSASTPGASSSGSPTPAAVAKGSPSASSSGCALKVTHDYLVRTTEPGTPATVDEIGNVDEVNCTPALQNFASEAGTAQGECTSIALASKNPGYPVNTTGPAPRLQHIIMTAGPGC